MSQRSLKVASQHIQRVKDALKRGGFASQQAFATELGYGRDTVRKFLNGHGIDRLNFIECCERLGLDWREIVDKPSETDQDADFVGREGDIATLNELGKRSRVILIQGAGGVGKTTLAKKYLADRFGENVIEFMIAKETDNIAPIEGLLEQCLRSLGEEPGRDFLVSLARLKEKLQKQPMGVLIDNLEPALDGTGRFIEPHRRYRELLRVLADNSLQSLTLITSREPLAEGLDISLYRLPSLTLDAWQDYFNSRESGVSSLFGAYRGNALAMKLLRERVSLDYEGDITAFWREHNQFGKLLTVENLIQEQFDRLKNIYPDAYRLLCRMGCFRYQDVPTVPLEGLFCLLWDVEENQRGRVVKALLDRSLVDRVDGEYQLHPLIREEAIERLKSGEDWERSNREAAEFWKKDVKITKTAQGALTFFEAYYHYKSIEKWDSCVNFLTQRSVTSVSILSILRSYGFIEKIMDVTHYLNLMDKKITSVFYMDIIAHLADIYHITGELKKASEFYLKSLEKCNNLSINYNDFKKDHEIDLLGAFYFISIRIGNYEKALQQFQELKIKAYNSGDLAKDYIPYITSCLSIINYEIDNKKEAYKYLSETLTKQDDLLKSNYMWIKIYGLYNIGKMLLTNNNLLDAKKIFMEMIKINSEYKLFKGLYHLGSGELYRIDKNYSISCNHHLESIKILEKIGAKCDLAEAYYQFGLTYQEMGENENSRIQFEKAIELWTEIDAPKQIEKVRKAMKKDDLFGPMRGKIQYFEDLTAPSIEEWTDT